MKQAMIGQAVAIPCDMFGLPVGRTCQRVAPSRAFRCNFRNRPGTIASLRLNKDKNKTPYAAGEENCRRDLKTATVLKSWKPPKPLLLRRRWQCTLATSGSNDSPPDVADFKWKSAELDELSAMMPDPEEDIFDLDGSNPEYERLISLGMTDNSDFDEILDEYITRMESKVSLESETESDLLAADWMIEAGAREHVDGDNMWATKEQMAINNFHMKSAFKDAIVRDRTEDCVYFNILNFQRANNRFKMCKEIGRWVEFFEEHSGENYSAVMTVPSWIKAVTMVNYEFHEYNDQHRIEDLDEVDDIKFEESIDLEHMTGRSGGVFQTNFDWETPPLQIYGMEHLTPETGYPKAAIAEANKLASDLLHWQGSSLHMGYYRKDMLPDYLKFQPIPSHLSELTDEELTQDLGVVVGRPHPLNERLQILPGWHTFIPSGVPGYYQAEAHAVKAIKSIEDRTRRAIQTDGDDKRVYILPEEDEEVDDKIDLLWKALMPQAAGVPETKLMDEILRGKDSTLPSAKTLDGDDEFILYDEDFEIRYRGVDDSDDTVDFDLE